MLEQLEIRKARISQQILELKSKESDQHEEQERCRREYDGVTEEIRKLNEKSGLINQELAVLQERLTSENQEIEKEQAEYHREASRLESLRNITERYDGYGKQHPAGDGTEGPGEGNPGCDSRSDQNPEGI